MKKELPIVEMYEYMLYPDSKNYPCVRVYIIHLFMYNSTHYLASLLIIRSPSIISALFDHKKINFGIIFTDFFCNERGYRTQHFPSKFLCFSLYF
jgi:hypothetical protein